MMGPFPTIGRIVLVMPHPGSPWVPAIITKVMSGICVNLRVFVDNDGGVEWMQAVMNEHYDGDPAGPKWRWPALLAGGSVSGGESHGEAAAAAVHAEGAGG